MIDRASLPDDAELVRAAIADARRNLVDREVLAEVVALCAVAREHVLVIGPPGTAKSEAVRRISSRIGGRYFEYLVGRFTEPNEIFGPVDLRRLREGVVEIETTGMLPEADVAFLDEVFLGSTAILNTLLGLLNERRFRRGATATDSPLRVCVGAANRLPEDPALEAFADRFLARVFVDAVPDARLEELLEAGRQSAAPARGEGVLDAVDRLAVAAETVDLTAVRPELAAAVRRLRAAGVPLSDRRAVRSQRLVAAATVLGGRTVASSEDLWVLPLVATTADGQALAGEVLSDLLARARNAALPFAAEEFSRGREARAHRLADTGRALLAEMYAATPSGDERLRIEATLREIDAQFGGADLPPALHDVRTQLVARIAPVAPAA